MLNLNRAALWIMVLAAGVVFQHPAWAQADRPIIIHGGSPLSIRYDGKWKKTNPLTLVTQHHDSTVTSVEVTLNGGAMQSIPFKNQQCDIRLKFGSIKLAVQTDPNGQNLRATIFGGASFDKDLVKKHARLYESRVSDARVESLTILKDGVPESIGSVTGSVDIVIRHQQGAPTP
jgi:hypothetical protein